MAILSRVEFGKALRMLEAGSHTYFQPPDGARIEYPCFIYSRDIGRTANADNLKYIHTDGYSVLYITKNPDTETPSKVMNAFQYCRDGKPYVKDNLYHFPFTIYNR
jgi:hypothetical protein